MTDDKHLAASYQPASSGGGSCRPPHTRARHRWLTLLVVVLLIGIPAGYLVVAARQSRASGEDKQRKAAATGLTHEWPAKVQRRIYDVPIPPYSTDVAYYETNTWKTSKLYVQFTTSGKGLDTFLHSLGASRSALRKGAVTIGAKEAATVGWRLGSGGDWAAMVHTRRRPKPEHEITVGFGNPAHPRVYVVSTVSP